MPYLPPDGDKISNNRTYIIIQDTNPCVNSEKGATYPKITGYFLTKSSQLKKLVTRNKSS
jgi:hypothetical protein